MIQPEMNFRKNIQLSLTDLDVAKKFAVMANDKVSSLANKIFGGTDLKINYQQLSNGNYEYCFENDSFTSVFELVVGWDMKLANGANTKFMALNSSGDGGHRAYKSSKKTLETLPDYGYYGGMMVGAVIGLGVSFLYAMETESLDATFYAVFTIITGWLGSIAGKFIGEKAYDKRFDAVTLEAMQDHSFLTSAAKWLTFEDEIKVLMEGLLRQDELNREAVE